ncbi:hypothetical protein L873DRAFT_1706659, partial [Choiromyces venosus 120613-1]
IYFQHDGVLAHHIKHTTTTFEELGMGTYLFPWPPCSPDISPIEGVWCILKCRILHHDPRPTTTPELYTTI